MRITAPARRGLATPRGVVLLTAFAWASPLPAPPVVQAHWIHLGARQLNLRDDHDVVRAAGEGRFKRVRLVVEGGELEMFDLRITFADGSTFSPGTRLVFRGSSRSRVIVLPGAARIVRWMDFYYRAIPAGAVGKAVVHLYGWG